VKNPNAWAAGIGYAASLGVQWLVARYAHAQLSDWWKQAVDGGVATAILWVGKQGLKSALQRIWNGPKTLWAGPAPKTASKAAS
jgi:hypothetical protein